MIQGIGNKILKRLLQNNINNVNQLASVEVKELQEILPNISPQMIEKLIFNARLYLERAIIIKQPFSLPKPQDVIYFDLESTTEPPRKVFLATYATLKDLYSVFEERNEPKKLVTKTQIFFDTHPQKFLMSSSGNSWDYHALINTFKKEKMDHSMISNRIHIDLFNELKESIVSPVGLGIKNLSKFLGFTGFDKLKEKDKRINGYVVAKIYESGKYSKNKKELIIRYNQLDVEALRFIHLSLIMLLNQRPRGKVYLSDFSTPKTI